ncbi:MAG TPA: histidine phosphatase family protein [Mycobacterium sp.]|nr:histidine phosphatase family protein [Mycobacterium sp.]
MPGPPITDQGCQQAMDVVNELSPHAYDGIYASTMVRSHETAAPLAEAPGEPITVLAGLREIEAGAYAQYAAAPLAWLRGDRNAASPDRSTAMSSTRASTKRC